MSKVLVLHEKHGDRYFDVTTKKRLRATLLHILCERWREGGEYGYPIDQAIEDHEHSKPQQLTDAELWAIPERFKHPAEEERKYFHENWREWLRHKDSLQFIKKAIEKNDGKAAMNAFHLRDSYEYEGWEIVEPEKISAVPKKDK